MKNTSKEKPFYVIVMIRMNQISLSISFQNLILQECDLDQLLRLYIKRVGDVKERFHGERTDHIRCFDRAQMRAADACFFG